MFAMLVRMKTQQVAVWMFAWACATAWSQSTSDNAREIVTETAEMQLEPGVDPWVSTPEDPSSAAADSELDIDGYELSYGTTSSARPLNVVPPANSCFNPGLGAGQVSQDSLEQSLVQITVEIRKRLQAGLNPAVWNRIVHACRLAQKGRGGTVSKSDQKAAIVALQIVAGDAFTQELIQRGVYRPEDYGGYSPMDLFVYAVTAYNEAREQKGGSWQDPANPYVRAEMVATMKVMQNRSKPTNTVQARTILEVALERGQFSGWTSGTTRSDPNFACMMAGPSQDLSQRRGTRAVVDLLDERTRYWPNAHKTKYFHARGGWPPGTPVRNPTVTLVGHAPIRLVLHNFGNVK